MQIRRTNAACNEATGNKNAAINRLCGGFTPSFPFSLSLSLLLPTLPASLCLHPLPSCVRRSASDTTARGNDRYVLTVRTRETFIREPRKGLKMFDALERILKGLKPGAPALVRVRACARGFD